MKKYLMMGAAALTLAFVNVGCSSDSEVYNAEATTVHGDFQRNFAQTFGKIDPNQDWGFKDIAVSNATRSANVNGNLWYLFERPYNVNLTDEEINELKALLTKTGETYNTQIFPYENYWVEQIYTGIADYTPKDNYGNDANGDKVKGSTQMNHLQARNGETYEHINNFNAGDNDTQYTDEGDGRKYIGITLMLGMSTNGITPTNQFGYDESWGTENGKFYNNYLIVEYKGEWYVGFDFEAHKTTATHNAGEQMQIDRDWAFTDWIVRISPANYSGNGILGRIIAEDLAAGKSDFDYNDVVFDVLSVTNVQYPEKNWNTYLTAKIAILAAGGTMPLWVGGKENGVEVHNAFGVSTSTMVNTQNGTVNKPIAIRDIILGEPIYNGTYNLKEIPIVVETADRDFKLEVETGRAPEMIQVENRYQWCDERQQIQTRYDKFPLWVSDRSVVWY